jgi:acyl dehydratase
MSVQQFDLHADLTEAGIEEAKSFVGMPLRVEPWHHEATLDTIRHYAYGIGDDNPLWSDEDYAAVSVHGGIVAPPTFLYSVYDGAIGLGLPGVQPFYAGTSWTFHEPIRRGDRFRPEATMGELEVREGSKAGPFIIQHVNTRYVRVADEVVVAEATAGTFRVARSNATQGLKYEQRAPQTYTDEELDDIIAQALSEPRRGGRPRYAREVQVGEELPPVVKGPLKQITMTAYYAGCIGSPGYKADEIGWRYRDWAMNSPERLPNNYDPSYFAERVLPSLGHQDASVARELGMPGAYGNGPQKCGWMGHAVTNWMGDGGHLQELTVRLRLPDVFGDVSWCAGTVESVTRDTRGRGRVTMRLHARNQRDEQTAEGSAVVLLPWSAGELI